MRALDLAHPVPAATRETTGSEAAQILAEHHLPSLVVADASGVPHSLIAGSQLLKIVVPRYVLDDPSLAHAYAEDDADDLAATLRQHTIGELLDADRVTAFQPPSVLPVDTLIEIATVMAVGHHPMILCLDTDGTYHGAITMAQVMGLLAGGPR